MLKKNGPKMPVKYSENCFFMPNPPKRSQSLRAFGALPPRRLLGVPAAPGSVSGIRRYPPGPQSRHLVECLGILGTSEKWLSYDPNMGDLSKQRW